MWEPRREYPSLRNEKRIGIDCETKDPLLIQKGAGFIRRDGYVVGISLATSGGFKAYYPIAHEGGGNLPRAEVISYLRDVLLHADQEKVFANAIYDLGWLRTLGIEVYGKKRDVQIAEPLIDENLYRYNLDSLGQRYLNQPKNWGMLKQGGIVYGVAKEKDLRANIWKMHSQYVGEYAEDDADMPLRILEKQLEILSEQGLSDVFELETDLIDVMLEMKFNGVPVDIDEAIKLVQVFNVKKEQAQREANKYTGMILDVWSNLSIAEACDKLKVSYDLTVKKNPTFTAEWLEAKSESIPLFKHIHDVRKYDRAGTFVQNSIIDVAVNGRVHCDYNQVRGDDYGTVSGRFSSSRPNLQQVPGRDKELAPLIRGLFKPDRGSWVKFDYSQQEPRLTVHYAYDRGFKSADIARNRYVEDPDTDYHQFIADLCNIERRPAKDINLGLAYGMGKNKMANKLGKSLAEAEEYFKAYHDNVPFVRALADECMRVANVRGYIKTILGRRRRFNLFIKGYGSKPLLYDDAVKEYGLPVKRAFTHKALNSLIQGGCGDMMKAAMLKLYRLGFPLAYLTVHDELDFGLEEVKEVYTEIKDVMENIFTLHLPLKVDVEIGNSWGTLDKNKYKNMI